MSQEFRRPRSEAELEKLAYEPYRVSRGRQELSQRVVSVLTGGRQVILNHWLWLINAFNCLMLAGTFIVPLLAATGWSWLSTPLYDLYGLVCLQRPGHSASLAGYQMGMEIRMVAISAGTVVAGLCYRGRGREPARGLSAWPVYIAFSLPMLVDIFSQTLELRESNWFWRSSTGFVFGLATVWVFYPRFEKIGTRLKVRLGL